MLIKLGDGWINPEMVAAIIYENGNIYIVMHGREQSLVEKEVRDGLLLADKYADKVNSALMNQSFGDGNAP